MRKLLLVLVLLFVATSASAQTATATATATPTPAPTFAVNVSMMTSQHTYVQATQIPRLNRERCSQWSLPSNCTTSDVKGAGCVVQPFQGATLGNPAFMSCTIYSSDAAGEAAYYGDLIASGALGGINADIGASVQASCLAWKAANNATRNATCAALGLSNGCIFYAPGTC